MGLTSSASPLCSSSGRTGASRTSSTTRVRRPGASQICPSAAATTVVGAQSVERDGQPVAVETALRAERSRRPRPRPSPRSGAPVRYTWSVRSPACSRTTSRRARPSASPRARPQVARRAGRRDAASCSARGGDRARRRRRLRRRVVALPGGPSARCPAGRRRRRGRRAGSAGTSTFVATPSTAVSASARSSARSAAARSAPCAMTLASIGS